MQINFPKKLLVISGLFLLSSLGVLFWLYGIINKNYDIYQQSSRDWQLEVARREKLSALDREIKKIDKEITEIETHFSHSSDVVPFLNTIDSIGLSAGVKSSVSAVNILPEQKGLLVELKATGSFGSIYKFLTLLENSPYELEFASMSLRKEEDQGVEAQKNGSVWSAGFKVKLISYIP